VLDLVQPHVPGRRFWRFRLQAGLDEPGWQGTGQHADLIGQADEYGKPGGPSRGRPADCAILRPATFRLEGSNCLPDPDGQCHRRGAYPCGSFSHCQPFQANGIREAAVFDGKDDDRFAYRDRQAPEEPKHVQPLECWRRRPVVWTAMPDTADPRVHPRPVSEDRRRRLASVPTPPGRPLEQFGVAALIMIAMGAHWRGMII
jgi:hypothetical protein